MIKSSPSQASLLLLKEAYEARVKAEDVLEDATEPIYWQIDRLRDQLKTPEIQALEQAVKDAEQIEADARALLVDWYSDHEARRNEALLQGKATPPADLPKWLRFSRQRSVVITDPTKVPDAYRKVEYRIKDLKAAEGPVPGVEFELTHTLSVISEEV